MSKSTFARAIAIEKSGVEGWTPFRWEVVGKDDMLITGGVARVLDRGPNKGRERWDGPGTRVVVTGKELDSAMATYEATTGSCAECEGSGKEVAGWSATSGTKYRTCAKCKGTCLASQQGAE
jgi:hypothetical protein